MPILSDQEIYALAYGAFGDLGTGQAVIIGAICLAESGGNPDAVFDNVLHGYQPPGSIYQFDRGLAQINSVHGFDAQRLYEPVYNLACARAVFNMQGFQAWSTFKGGQFRAFLSRMQAAANASVAWIPVPDRPTPFARDDLRPLYLQLYGYDQRISIEPDGFEGDGRRRYQLLIP